MGFRRSFSWAALAAGGRARRESTLEAPCRTSSRKAAKDAKIAKVKDRQVSPMRLSGGRQLEG